MEPVPGVYEYKKGRGWYLVEYLENTEPSSSSTASTISSKKSNKERLPRQVIKCRVLDRWMFTCDYEKRRHFEYVQSSGDDSQVDQVGFYRLDDGVTYIQCWDTFGHFIPGPYQRWCKDAKTKRMRPMVARDAVLEGQNLDGRDSRRDSWEKMQREQSYPDPSRHCSVCSSPSVRSLRRPVYEGRASASTFAESSRSQGTALTTPASGLISRQQTSEEVDPKELRAELMKINGQ